MKVHTTTTLFVLLAAAAAVGLCVPIPKIPCTFVAEISFRSDRGNGEAYNYTHYSLDSEGFQAYSQVGTLPDYTRGTATKIFVPPNRYTLITPFLDRQVCTTLPVRSSMQCFSIDFDATCSGQGRRCYFDRTRYCNIFTFVDMYERDQSYYIYNDSTATAPILDAVIIDGQYKDEYLFHSWSLEAPDRARFEPPQSQPCTDLVPGPRTAPAPASEAHKPALLRRPRLHMMRERKRPVNVGPLVPGADAIPAEFDARQAWPKCGIDQVRREGREVYSWDFAAAGAFGDRACIAAGLAQPAVMSPQYIKNCYTELDGCDGGYVDLAWQGLATTGIAAEQCVPFAGRKGACPAQCADGSPVQVVRAAAPYSPYVPFNTAKTVAAIQTEIMRHGPVDAAMWAFSDLASYGGGVYEKLRSTFLQGTHAVKIIGWGYDSVEDEPYWLCANSWGEEWGEKGLFRIRRGTNECGIEDRVVAAIPLV